MHPILQIIADILFFAVFILLFLALVLYLVLTTYPYIKTMRDKSKKKLEQPIEDKKL